MSWVIEPSNVPQLRLFSMDSESPRHIPGLEKDAGRRTLHNLDERGMDGRALKISRSVSQLVVKHEKGSDYLLRSKRDKTEL
eukprot:SAG11_NODE_2065_length_3869_cov_1.739523_2_plen_82_part_00